MAERRVSTLSGSNVTLEDLQRSIAVLQSQIDRQARLARRDISANEQPPPRSAAYSIRATGPPSDSASSDEDPPAVAQAFGIRDVPYNNNGKD